MWNKRIVISGKGVNSIVQWAVPGSFLAMWHWLDYLGLHLQVCSRWKQVTDKLGWHL